MKFNWGWGILFTCIGFIVFISSMVYRATREKIDFVTENYYDKELRFQEHINQELNAASLSEKVKIGFHAGQNEITIRFPSGFDSREISGEINFFKPDDSKQDFVIPVKCNTDHLQAISASRMKRGWWSVKLSWSAQQTPFYSEEKIFLN